MMISHCLSNLESVANCVCKLQVLRAQLKRCSCLDATVGLLEYKSHRLREMEMESVCHHEVNRICMYLARRTWRFRWISLPAYTSIMIFLESGDNEEDELKETNPQACDDEKSVFKSSV